MKGLAMSPETLKTLVRVLDKQLQQTKHAYHTGMPGVTYEDMTAAATRLLQTRAMYERESGRPVRSKVNKQAIANLIR